MSKTIDLMLLTRPVNSIMVGFAVIVGISVSAPNQLLSVPTLLGFLTGFLISSYSMVVNDWYDLEVDRINSPDRPLASGRIHPKTAAVFAGIMLTIGLISSILIGLDTFIIASVFAAIAWIYNYQGKKQMLLGNMMVAASVAIPYIYGGATVGMIDDRLLWFLALTSFLAATGREIIKTIADVNGDAARQVKSIARVYGSRIAAYAGAFFFLGAVASTVIPILVGEVGIVFTVLILIPDILFIYAAVRIIMDYSKLKALQIKKIALIGMIIGMVIFIIGGSY
ncbi:MAG: geranylgeranylglycerol-phosphate geranylgeranyltransferase [Candidatus Poseidoniia archaeon]|nr:geranylgeranylglycerol-phosphate geranylgeranyltransferase [Candidatus Poseidoniia archaeon]